MSCKVPVSSRIMLTLINDEAAHVADVSVKYNKSSAVAEMATQ